MCVYMYIYISVLCSYEKKRVHASNHELETRKPCCFRGEEPVSSWQNSPNLSSVLFILFCFSVFS